MQELHLHDPYTIWFDQRPLVITCIIGIILIVSLLLYILINLYKKYKSVKKYSLLEKALLKLDGIDTQTTAVWYAQVGTVIKEYFQGVYGMSQGLTDQEIIKFLNTLELSTADKKLLSDFFSQAEQAKFSTDPVPLQGEFIPQIQDFFKKTWNFHLQNIKGNK